jgi:hypothetical protein
MREAALEYAAMGWPVFPVHTPTDGRCSCGQTSCGSIGKHPRTRRGLHDATIDLDVVVAWWEQWPDANIGIRTGIAFDALDIDVDDLAEVGFEEPIELPGGPTARTGGGGWHFLFAPTGLGNRARLVAHADWRGDGGYIVAAPSLHASGQRYRWIAPAALDLQPAPADLLDHLQPRRSVAPLPPVPSSAKGAHWSAAGLVTRLANATEGTRNDVLNWAAFRLVDDLRSGRAPREAAAQAIDDLAATAAAIGLTDREIEATIRSATRAVAS